MNTNKLKKNKFFEILYTRPREEKNNVERIIRVNRGIGVYLKVFQQNESNLNRITPLKYLRQV